MEAGRAIERSPVQEKNPINVWVGRSRLPTSEEHAIVGAHKEAFATRVKARKNLVGLDHLPRGQPAAEGVKNSGPRTKPARAKTTWLS